MSDTDKPDNGNTPENQSDSNETTAQASASSETSANGDSSAERMSDSKSDQSAGQIVERVLCMILFGFIGYFVFWAICLLAVVQFIFSLISKEANDDLKRFTANLAEYMRQIGAYLGYATDERPCPFGPFPSTETT